MVKEIRLFKKQTGEFKKEPYGIGIKAAFSKCILTGIHDPGFRNRKDIVLGLKRISALAVNFPNPKDGKTLAEQRVVRMDDRCCS